VGIFKGKKYTSQPTNSNEFQDALSNQTVNISENPMASKRAVTTIEVELDLISKLMVRKN